MTPAPRTAVVLGGGVLGTSTAHALQRAGVVTTLLTRGEPADGASGRSLSWLNSAGARSEAYHLLRTVGIDRYRTLFAQDPTRAWLRFDGGLWWSTGADEARARHTHETSIGYDSEALDPEQVSARFPGVRAAAPAVHNPGEGWVSLPHLIAHLAGEFTAAGGTLRTGAGECAVLVEDGRAAGVRAGDGSTVRADAVVVACGASTPAVLAGFGVDLPDASPLSALVETEPVDSPVRTVLNTPRAALRPQPGGGFAVDHDWYVEQIEERPDGSCALDGKFVDELLAEAGAVLDGTPLEAARWRAGRKPIPADGEPVLGELSAVSGCHVVFTHSGATLGLIVGELIAHGVTTGTAHPLVAPFSPRRFGC
ncbi:NAD(P)/FAD-dependent oxidoreductase [Kineococcus sp. SYSU DK003]|uniref:NAD(P)/FAD-dependent oxidoreductase n=1 Tax=Kineococcus sp. SYSU DK003 TaxID=3383124 RepID=UPI003D7CF4AF